MKLFIHVIWNQDWSYLAFRHLFCVVQILCSLYILLVLDVVLKNVSVHKYLSLPLEKVLIPRWSFTPISVFLKLIPVNDIFPLSLSTMPVGRGMWWTITGVGPPRLSDQPPVRDGFESGTWIARLLLFPQILFTALTTVLAASFNHFSAAPSASSQSFSAFCIPFLHEDLASFIVLSQAYENNVKTRSLWAKTLTWVTVLYNKQSWLSF